MVVSIASTRVPQRTLTSWRWSSARTTAPSSGSTVGRTSGSCSTWVTARPQVRERLGHLEPDVAGTDDHRAPDLAVLEGAHQRERVAHRVQEMHAVARAEAVEPADRRPDRHRAGPDDQRVVVDHLLAAVGRVGATWCEVGSTPRATVSSRRVMPVSGGPRRCGGRGCASRRPRRIRRGCRRSRSSGRRRRAPRSPRRSGRARARGARR